MKIIIVGGGKTGSALARSLSGENHDVTVIEKRADRLQELCDDNDIMGIVGRYRIGGFAYCGYGR